MWGTFTSWSNHNIANEASLLRDVEPCREFGLLINLIIDSEESGRKCEECCSTRWIKAGIWSSRHSSKTAQQMKVTWRITNELLPHSAKLPAASKRNSQTSIPFHSLEGSRIWKRRSWDHPRFVDGFRCSCKILWWFKQPDVKNSSAMLQRLFGDSPRLPAKFPFNLTLV